MHSSTHDIFIKSLEKIFGPFDPELKKFSDQSNSVIARELFYSDSQFSRLVNQTASEGEYKRANKIISRYHENLTLKSKLKDVTLNRKDKVGSIIKDPILIILFTTSLIIAAILGANIFPKQRVNADNTAKKEELEMDYMLKWAFEKSNVSPYTSLNDLPEDCNYPCYRLQGKWKLKSKYKFPVFGEKSGFHYLATEVNMYARCISENNTNGKELEGYEYQKHEIWYDVEEQPIDSFLYNTSDSVLKETYLKTDFSANDNFVKVAHIHTFFRNVFTLSDRSIKRKGKVIGRYIEYEDISSLKAITNQLSATEIENYIKNIVTKRVEDYSRPIQCSDGQFERNSVYDIEEDDLINFECIMTTGRVPVAYEKTYILEDQAIKNHCRPSGS